MHIRVLYFAAARDLASMKTETISVLEGAAVKDLAVELKKVHPGLRKLEDSVRFSVNSEVVDGSSPLREGDVVGVLPPVAGG
jgi:molybdopterin synthase sulfur carrier subunit